MDSHYLPVLSNPESKMSDIEAICPYSPSNYLDPIDGTFDKL